MNFTGEISEYRMTHFYLINTLADLALDWPTPMFRLTEDGFIMPCPLKETWTLKNSN